MSTKGKPIQCGTVYKIKVDLKIIKATAAQRNINNFFVLTPPPSPIQKIRSKKKLNQNETTMSDFCFSTDEVQLP